MEPSFKAYTVAQVSSLEFFATLDALQGCAVGVPVFLGAYATLQWPRSLRCTLIIKDPRTREPFAEEGWTHGGMA